MTPPGRREGTLRLRNLVLVPLTMTLAMLLAPSAAADTYTDQLVSRFNTQTHVVAETASRPPLQNPDQLNQQILTSSWTWSSGPPIWVSSLSPSQDPVTTADALHNVMLGR